MQSSYRGFLFARIFEEQLRWAPRHSESDSACQSAESVAQTTSKSTSCLRKRPNTTERVSPMISRFDARNVPRGLREQYQNLNSATTKAIWHAQSDEKEARWHPRISPNTLCAPGQMSTENLNNDVLQSVDRLLIEVYKALRLPWNMSEENQKWSRFHVSSALYNL